MYFPNDQLNRDGEWSFDMQNIGDNEKFCPILTWVDTFFICINPLPNKPLFLHVRSTSLLKTLWEKVVRNKQFLLFQQCLLHFSRTFH